ncbi:MAG: thioredoxin-disulfide reductase [Clostridiaceae bacterium]
MSKETKAIDLVIIGSGPAGLTAAIYASRAKLSVLVLENAITGGQVRSTYTVENYPGFEIIEGSELADKMQNQALKLGAVVDEFDSIVSVTLNNNEKIIETESYIYKPKAVVIASGAAPKKLPIQEEADFSSRGIHYCAVCDGALYEGKTIGVVGGGNSALEEALFLSKFGKVKIIRRYDYFNGEKITLEEVEKNKDIEILWNEDIKHVRGENKVEVAVLENTKTKEQREVQLDAVFVYIGNEPKTELFKEQITMNQQGYIVTDESMKTNVEGVFAAGDVRDKVVRQITTAVSDGTIAALMAEKYINEKGRD